LSTLLFSFVFHSIDFKIITSTHQEIRNDMRETEEINHF